MEMDAVKLENIGPIEGVFEIDLSAGPGLYELKGGKGRGKSTVLASLSLVAGHRTTLTLHDGATNGEVRAFGRTVPVGDRRRKRGELDVEVLDSTRFDLADLIDPPGKTPAVRDSNRIKALASLSGLKLSPADFKGVLGGLSPESLGVDLTDDPVLLASRIKEKIDAEARTHERLAENGRQRAAAASESIADLDLSDVPDVSEAAEAAEAAAIRLSELHDARQAAEAARYRGAEAEKALEALDPPDMTELEKDLATYESQRSVAVAEIRRLTALLAEAQKEAGIADSQVASANIALSEGRKAHAAAEEFRRQIEAAKTVKDPADLDITGAQATRDQARERHAQAIKLQSALGVKDQIARDRKGAAAEEEKAADLRNQAARVMGVLADRLELRNLKVVAGDDGLRLVVQHEKRGETAFDQANGLSDGERVHYSLSELLQRLGSPALFPIPQRVYQDLDPTDRTSLARYAAKAGVYIFGAQITDGDLRAEKVE